MHRISTRNLGMGHESRVNTFSIPHKAGKWQLNIIWKCLWMFLASHREAGFLTNHLLQTGTTHGWAGHGQTHPAGRVGIGELFWGLARKWWTPQKWMKDGLIGTLISLSHSFLKQQNCSTRWVDHYKPLAICGSQGCPLHTSWLINRGWLTSVFATSGAVF